MGNLAFYCTTLKPGFMKAVSELYFVQVSSLHNPWIHILLLHVSVSCCTFAEVLFLQCSFYYLKLAACLLCSMNFFFIELAIELRSNAVLWPHQRGGMGQQNFASQFFWASDVWWRHSSPFDALPVCWVLAFGINHSQTWVPNNPDLKASFSITKTSRCR